LGIRTIQFLALARSERLKLIAHRVVDRLASESLFEIFFPSPQKQYEESKVDKLEAGVELSLAVFPQPPTFF
jgi:hypothetical protein